MAGTTLHEEKDDVLCLPPAMWNLGKGWVRGSLGKQRLVGQCGKSDCSESYSCGGEEMSAVEGVLDAVAAHA